MSNHIFEELPARKHSQVSAGAVPAKADKPDKKATGGTEESSEKRIRQAVYDIRYRARREDIDLKAAFSQYMSNTSMNALEQREVKAKLFGKEGGMKEQYSMESVAWATDAVVSALQKVFVEGVSVEDGEPELVYERQIQAVRKGKEVTLYSVRVTDPKTGKSYTRDADREKITDLRARGLKVEMSDQKPGEAQRDMTKKNDGNLANNYPPYDKVTRGDVIAGATGKDQMGGKRKVEEGTTFTGARNTRKLDVMPSGMVNKVSVLPKDGSDQQTPKSTIQAGVELGGQLISEKSKALQVFQEMHGICPRCGKCPCECDKKDKERDTRSDKTYRDVVKNKLRSMGMKDPLIMADPEKLEKDFAKIASADSAKVVEEGFLDLLFNSKKRRSELQGGTYHKKPERKGETGILSNISKRNQTLRDAGLDLNSYKAQGEVVSEEESDRARDTHQQRGGMAARVDHERPPAKKLSNAELGIKPGKTWVQKEMERRANERAGNNHPGPDSKPRKTPQAAKGSSSSDVSRNLQSRYGGSSIARSTTTKKED